MGTRSLLLSSVAGFALFTAASALAQTASPESPPAQLPAITVEGQQVEERADGPVEGYRATRSATGTKTDTPLKDVPQTINVVPRQVIEDRQTTRLSDALLTVPGVQANGTNGGRGQNFTLRGFQTQTVATDGIMQSPALNFTPVTRDLANIERVEVLKGPSSVLYGRTEPGGLINLVTKKPTDTFTGSATLQGGSYDFYRGEGTVSGPLDAAATLTARMTAAVQTEGSFRYDNDDTRNFFAPVVNWAPRDDTRFTLGADHTEQDSQFDRGLVAVGNRVLLLKDRYYSEDWARYDARVDNVTAKGEHDLNDWLTLRQVVNYTVGDTYRLVANPGTVNTAGTTLSRTALRQTEDFDSWDLQSDAVMKFQTGSIGHTVVTGYEYVNGDRTVRQINYSLASISLYNPVYGAEPGTITSRNNVYTRMYINSLYAQDQIKLNDQWELVLGLRYDKLDQTTVTQNVATHVDDQNWGPKAGVVYKPVPRLSLYANYSTSFSPQTTAILGGGTPDPEKGVQYETGARYELIPDRLSVGAAIYQITKENVATASGVTNFSVLTGEQRSRGFETDLTGEILPGWSVIAGWGYTDAEVTSDRTTPVGNRLANVPNFAGGLWSVYQFQSGQMKGLGLGAGVTYVGSRNGDLANTYSVDGYYRFDASVFYDLNDRIRLSLSGRNLTDQDYVEQTVNSRVENIPGAPMTVIAGVTAKF
ncbi:TonB-dependent siderophore receptor [Ferrovibrio terrae]|uniref:TonB-dependent siderophore receptor n=1 Tax=Ferrovibrio terrae TaxID=2594003 RepID=UPI003137FF5F